jgi:hypothetical protein
MTMHPLKLSTSFLSIKNKKIEITTRIFTDDLEPTLRESCNRPSVDLVNIGYDRATTDCAKKYLLKNLKIFVNGKELPLLFKGIKLKEDDNIVTIVELNTGHYHFKKGDKITLKNTIMFDNIPEQKNVVNIDAKGTNSFDQTLVYENSNNDVEKSIILK